MANLQLQIKQTIMSADNIVSFFQGCSDVSSVYSNLQFWLLNLLMKVKFKIVLLFYIVFEPLVYDFFYLGHVKKFVIYLCIL